MNVKFDGPGGTDPIQNFSLVQDAARSTVGLARTVASSQIQRIRTRTAQGVDADGSAFPPYSPAYARRKLSSGGNGVVNLFSTLDHDHMMAVLSLQVNGQEYIDTSAHVDDQDPASSFDLGFFDQAEIEIRARIHNEGGSRVPQRRFLDLSDSDVTDSERMAGEYIENKLQRLI